MSNTTLAAVPKRSLMSLMDAPPPAQLMTATKQYGTTVALRGVDLTIRPGELVALLGANGAGKTTAVRLLLGLAAPTSGTARVFGADPREPQGRARTGAMLQVGRVPETMKVREYLHLFSSYYTKPLSRAEIVEAASLHGIEDRRFGNLSGGQKQRVLFALAICGNPDLLILDEPTVGLDVEARRAMWEQIRRFVARGCSILLTTHYLAEADALADRVIVIDKGAVVAEGTPSQIKGEAHGKIIRCTTALTVDEVRNVPFVTAAKRDGATTEIATTDSDAVLRALMLRDMSLANVEVTSAGLEEAFLKLVGGSEH